MKGSGVQVVELPGTPAARTIQTFLFLSRRTAKGGFHLSSLLQWLMRPKGLKSSYCKYPIVVARSEMGRLSPIVVWG